MKKLTNIILIATLLSLTACQSDDEVQRTTGTIQLQLGNLLPYTELLTRSEGTVADFSKYTFTLSGITIGGVTVTDLVLNVTSEGTAEVNAGTYTLTADNRTEANRDSGHPWYNGTSEPFTVSLNTLTPVSIALGKPKNARITMAIDASFTELYDAPVLTLSDGTRSLTLTSAEDVCYFIIPADGALAYSITADAKAGSHATDMKPATGYVEIQSGYNTTITLKAHPATGIIIPVASGTYNATFD